MSNKISGNYLRAHRRKFGLTQNDLAKVVGYGDKEQVARHEQSLQIPPLLVALAYESVFGVPVSTLFAGFQSTVALNVKANLRRLQSELAVTEKLPRTSRLTEEKLAWLGDRLRLP